MKKTSSGIFKLMLAPRVAGEKPVQRPYETWGVFRQSDGVLLDTAKARIGAVAKARKWSREAGDCYVDKFILP